MSNQNQLSNSDLNHKKPRVLWFAYKKEGGWAFENRTYNLVNNLPGYEHVILPPIRDLKLIEIVINMVDIVVVWHDVDYSGLSDTNKGKVIQSFTGERMFIKILDKIPSNGVFTRGANCLRSCQLKTV